MTLFCAGILAVGIPNGMCWSQEGTEISGSVGSGTVPPTSYQSGLVDSINPIDTSGNLVITGNVSGGRHFRGIVPYRGVMDFEAAPGSLQHTSGALDSFMRYSAGFDEAGRYSGEPMPFYSQTQTVTSTRPGQTGVFGPQSGLRGVTLDKGGTGEWRVEGVSSGADTLATDADARPVSLTLRELEKMIPNEVTTYPQGGRRTSKGDGIVETGLNETRKTSDRASGADLGVQGEPFGWFTGQQAGPGKVTKPQVQEDTAETTGPQMLTEFTGTAENVWGVDVYEQMLQQAGKIPTGLEKPANMTGIEASGGKEPQTGQEITGGDRLTTSLAGGSTGRVETGIPAVRAPGVKTAGKGQEATGTAMGGGTAGAKKQVTLGEYKSFAGMSDDKFNQYIRAAEVFMKAGKYYRAADAYTVASVYKREDPLGYAGKSCALFAAGEYMSSALYLATALELFPEYAKFKIDLVALIGDKDKIETRLAEARQLGSRSKSGEMDFLLAYMYYQLGRLEFARVSIESASGKMPDSPAVGALKKAIDEYIASM